MSKKWQKDFLHNFPIERNLTVTFSNPFISISRGKHLAELSAQGIEDCKVEYIEGSGHFVNVENPDEVNRIIRSYLQSN